MVEPEFSTNASCFLCDLPTDLIIFETSNFVALAGLGPIVDGYCLLASKMHTRSMADVPDQLRAERSQALLRLRSFLTDQYGSCRVTEHGRMAVCTDDTEHDHHCFHAHFLLFPGAPDITSVSSSYFRQSKHFGDIEEALTYAASFDEYFLSSESGDRHTLFAGPLNMPRQLARILVASQLGRLNIADWKQAPRRDDALRIAHSLRSRLSS